MVQTKTVYVDDVAIGEASNWEEVEVLLGDVGIAFIDRPGAAEGPTGFFIYGASVIARDRKSTQGGV